MHNKKLMVVAVAAALAAPGAALAQSSTVQIFGNIIQNVTYLDQGGNRLKTDLQNNHDAEIGFRGEEKLGGSLSAWFQCASTLDLNAGAATDTLCGRNSAVGFKGDWGNAFVGLWNTPLRDFIYIPLRPVIAPGGGTSEVLHNSDAAAGNNVTNTGSQMNRRPKNIIQYWSPNWNGFELRGALTTANEATSATSATTGAKPRLWTIAGRYVNGPIYLAAGYESHKDYNPAAATTTAAANTTLTVSGVPGVTTVITSTAASGSRYSGGTDSIWSIGGQYTFGGVFRLIGMYNWIKYDANVGTATTAAVNNMDAQTYAIYAAWQIQGPHRLSGGISVLKDTSGTTGCGTAAPIRVGTWVANCGAGGTGAKYYQLQYGYSFSKRTETYVTYQYVDNDNLAVVRVNQQGAGLAAPAGESQTAWTVGIRHTF